MGDILKSSLRAGVKTNTIPATVNPLEKTYVGSLSCDYKLLWELMCAGYEIVCFVDQQKLFSCTTRDMICTRGVDKLGAYLISDSPLPPIDAYTRLCATVCLTFIMPAGKLLPEVKQSIASNAEASRIDKLNKHYRATRTAYTIHCARCINVETNDTGKTRLGAADFFERQGWTIGNDVEALCPACSGSQKPDVIQKTDTETPGWAIPLNNPE